MSDFSCPVHDGRPCVMACISCTYFFVCDKCIESESHHGHQLMTFDSASRCVVKRLYQEQVANAAIKKHLESDLAQCLAIIQKEQDLSDWRKQTIITKRESLKSKIDFVADKLLQQYDREAAVVLDKIDAEKKLIENSILSADEFQKEVDSLLTCENSADIIAIGRLLERPDNIRGPFPTIPRSVLQDRDPTEDDIRHLFGDTVVENVKLLYPSFFNEDGTFIILEKCFAGPQTPGSTHECILKGHEDVKTPHPLTTVNPDFTESSFKCPEDTENVRPLTSESQDSVLSKSTKKETESFHVVSEDLESVANLPRLPLLETEICDDTEMESEETNITHASDSVGNLPCQNMKNYDNFLRLSDDFSHSDSTFDGSFSSSVSTPAYCYSDYLQRNVDEKVCDKSNEEDVFVPTETETDEICVKPEMSSSLESLTVTFNDHEEAVQHNDQVTDGSPKQVPACSDQDEDVFYPSIIEEPSYSNDDQSDNSSLGKVMERGNSFKHNYFECVQFEKIVPRVVENGDSKPAPSDLAGVEFEPVILRPKSKSRDLFPSKEFPIMERKSKEIDVERTNDRLEGNKDDSVIPRVLFDDVSPSVHRVLPTLTDMRRSVPDTHKYRTMPVSRKSSFLQQDPSARLKLKQSFSIDSPVIIACPTSEGRCWVSSFNRENEIVQLNRRGRVKRTVQFDTLVLGMTLLDANQLLVCCRDEMCIKQVLQDFHVRTFFSTAPLRPSYISSGFTDEMFVTLTNKTTWSIEHGTTSVAVKYSGSTCQEMARAQFDEDGDDLFFFPSRICLNSRCRSVVIINYTSPSMSHLVMLDRHMSLVCRYIDHNKVISAKQTLPKLSEKFFITDVTFDPYDNIFIAEHYTKEIQLLDQSCQLLRVMVSEQATPWSLALHSNGYLWVGFDNGLINVYSSKLKSKRVVSLQRSIPSPW